VFDFSVYAPVRGFVVLFSRVFFYFWNGITFKYHG